MDRRFDPTLEPPPSRRARLPHFVVSLSLPEKTAPVTKELSCTKNKKLVAVFNYNLHATEPTTKVECGRPYYLKSIAICRTGLRRRRSRDGSNRIQAPSDRRQRAAKTKRLRRWRHSRITVWVHHPDASMQLRRTRPTAPTGRGAEQQQEACAFTNI